jgi:flagellar motor switch protein FliN/FliY
MALYMGSTDNRQVAPATPHTLDFVEDVPLSITVEFGRAEITIRKLLLLDVGSVLELDGRQGDSLVIRIHGNPCARGEVVAVNDHYGVRITEVLEPKSS